MSVAEVHWVALGMSAGVSPALVSMPMGMSKLFRMWKHWATVSVAVGAWGVVAW